MSLSAKAKKVLEVALANKAAAKEMTDEGAKQDADILKAMPSHKVVMVIVATAASTTTDFGDLLVGDLVMKLPATPGAVTGGACTVDGTSPVTPAIGDAVVVMRAV